MELVPIEDLCTVLVLKVEVLVVLSVDLEVASVGSALVLLIVVSVLPVELEEADAMLETSEVTCIDVVVIVVVLEIAGDVPMLSSVIEYAFKRKLNVLESEIRMISFIPLMGQFGPQYP